MAHAVIKSGGKQYRVSEGDTVVVDRLGGEPGTEVTFSDVLLISGEKPKVGKPTVAGAKVTAEIVEQMRDKKIVVFKFRRRKRYRRKAGHRQQLTSVKIKKVTG